MKKAINYREAVREAVKELFRVESVFNQVSSAGPEKNPKVFDNINEQLTKAQKNLNLLNTFLTQMIILELLSWFYLKQKMKVIQIL